MNRETRGKSSSPAEKWATFDLKTELHRYERKMIGKALLDAGGNRSQAARFLKIKRQALNYLLDKRHKGLAEEIAESITRKRQ
jgi:DNA-binding NtrC family response regulator